MKHPTTSGSCESGQLTAGPLFLPSLFSLSWASPLPFPLFPPIPSLPFPSLYSLLPPSLSLSLLPPSSFPSTEVMVAG